MKTMNKILLLFTVIALEGYVVLSAELLAIRQSIPFVGSGTDTVSIIIAAVLMPLAFGYYAGGKFKPGFQGGKYKSVRKKLVFNMFIALFIYVIGLSYALVQDFFEIAIDIGIENRLILTSLYAGIFLAIPTYLLGQTIPLISNYFSKEKLAQVTGRILFISTLGSFMGAVFTTLVLISMLGVNYTAVIAFAVLAFLIFILSKRKLSEMVIMAVFLACGGAYLNSPYVLSEFNIIKMNNYNVIGALDLPNGRHLLLNNNPSSKLSDDGQKYPYIMFAEEMGLDPLTFATPARDILVIGAGAFTFGLEDDTNNFDFVDIDKDLQEVSEEHILREELGENKKFHALPARAFLAQTDKKYDVILMDTYYGHFTLPEHLATREYFQQVKDHLKDDGVVIANFIVSPNFETPFSRHIDNTFRSVFHHVNRHVIREKYDLWDKSERRVGNVIYMYKHRKDADPSQIYSDIKNRAFLDMPKKQK